MRPSIRNCGADTARNSFLKVGRVYLLELGSKQGLDLSPLGSSASDGCAHAKRGDIIPLYSSCCVTNMVGREEGLKVSHLRYSARLASGRSNENIL